MVNVLLSWTSKIFFLSTIAIVMSWPYIRRQSNALIYGELQRMNAHCHGSDTCRGSTLRRNLQMYNCQCDVTCALLGTCCLDSPYRTRRWEHRTGPMECKQPYGVTSETVFLVNGCEPDWNGEKSIEHLCIGHPDTLKDPFLMVPVTDPRTGISYKNYFCYVCNGLDESSYPPIFWDIKLFSDPEMNNNSGPGLFRDMQAGRKAVADYIFQDYYFYPSVEIPEQYRFLVQWCRTGVRATCAEDWTDAKIKDKCESYTALVWTKENWLSRYKNPHCAICNHVETSELKCSEESKYQSARGPPYGYLFVGLLSMEDKVQRCPRNNVFDPLSNKCRTLRCGARRTLMDGECVPDVRSPNPPKRTRPASTPKPRQSWLVVS